MRDRRRMVDEKMFSLRSGGGLDERSLVFWQLSVFEIRAAVFWPCSPSLCCPLDDARRKHQQSCLPSPKIRAAVFLPCSPSLCCPLDDARRKHQQSCLPSPKMTVGYASQRKVICKHPSSHLFLQFFFLCILCPLFVYITCFSTAQDHIHIFFLFQPTNPFIFYIYSTGICALPTRQVTTGAAGVRGIKQHQPPPHCLSLASTSTSTSSSTTTSTTIACPAPPLQWSQRI